MGELCFAKFYFYFFLFGVRCISKKLNNKINKSINFLFFIFYMKLDLMRHLTKYN